MTTVRAAATGTTDGNTSRAGSGTANRAGSGPRARTIMPSPSEARSSALVCSENAQLA